MLTIVSATAASGEHGPFRIACYPNLLPYSGVSEDGEMSGLLIDVWRRWSEKTGVGVEFVPLAYSESIKKIVDGTVDVHCGLVSSDKRASELTFTDAIVRMRSVLFVRDDVPGNSAADLKTRIAAVREDYAVDFLEGRFPGIEFQLFKTYAEFHAAIRDKTLRAFIAGCPRNMNGYKTLPPPDGYREVETLYTERLRAAVKRGNNDLADRINMGFARVSDEEMWNLASKWNFYQKDNTLLIVVFVSIGALLLLLLFTGIIVAGLRTRLRHAKDNSD